MKNERRRKQEFELLSACLDGELDPAKQRKLETRLQQDPELQEQLESFRKTKLILRSLPRLRAPRNYTLTPAMVKVHSKKKPPVLINLQLASALAAILLVVLFGVEFLFTSGPLARPQLGAKPMMEAALVADEAEPEPLIVWGVPGAGGFGSDAPVGMGGDAGMMEEPVLGEALPVEPEIPAEEEPVLEAESRAPDAQEAEMPQMPPSTEKELPILGINLEEGGEIIQRSTDNILDLEIELPTWRAIVRVLQITLGLIAVGGGLTWWLLRRHGVS